MQLPDLSAMRARGDAAAGGLGALGCPQAWIALAISAAFLLSPAAASAEPESSPACRTAFVKVHPSSPIKGEQLLSANVMSALRAALEGQKISMVNAEAQADLVISVGARGDASTKVGAVRTYYYPHLNAWLAVESRYGGGERSVAKSYPSGSNALSFGAAVGQAAGMWSGVAGSFTADAMKEVLQHVSSSLKNGVRIASDPPGAAIELKAPAQHAALAADATTTEPKVLGCFPAGTLVQFELRLEGYRVEDFTLRAAPVVSHPAQVLKRLETPTTAASGGTAAASASSSSSTGEPPPPRPAGHWLWALGVGVLAIAVAAYIVVARRREQPAEPPAVAVDPKRAELRAMLHFVLKSDSAFTAFCFDNFEKEVYKDLSDGMERDQKITILMRDVRHEDIRTRLREQFPEEVAEFERARGKAES